jgi:plastocyanin
MRKGLILIAVIALAGSVLVACGDDDDDDGGDTTAAETATTDTAAGGGAAGGGSTVDVSAPANGDLAFDQTDLTATAGSVTINFDNPASISHDVKVEDSAGEELGGTDLISQSNATATVDLQPGSYTFFCSVPGHREAGMEGTLTVN